MIDKNLFGYLSLLFSVLSNAPYIYTVLQGKTKPHLFTWVIWTLVSAIGAAAQYAGHAGPGWWAAALSAVFCLVTVLLSFKYGEKKVTQSDWIAFVAALSSIPIWYITASPLAAIVLVTVTDVLGYYPTLRKSYVKPREEMIFSYSISNLKHIASVFAIKEYSLTTLLFPVVLFFMNGVVIAMLTWRRRMVRGPEVPL